MIGFFHHYFVEPFASLIHLTASFFDGSYGMAIIIITLVIRLILSPFMLKQYKNQQQMRVKMDLIKPEMDEIKKRMKEEKDPAVQRKMQQEMLELYKKHNMSPLSFGCLPILIQMPILMGFYYAIRGSKEIASHTFLWFNLGHPNIILAIVAGIIYYLQFKVQQSNMPKAQAQSMKWMGLISPIMILFVSINAPAALPLYWSVGGLFLIGQTLFAKAYLTKKEPEKAIQT
ncbi:YidC/Oxa1 family membrane protein insertase [Scopulibacillus darangshiensis]|uniref:YidC/Oxa1 family membrane protein insertase n=1 Tax=Scopulibacillus darangshiensis TaxID=442528 RepID=A0A4R2P8Q7_9BACL|nr:membrane protein insertase YidC [Scopulibacillus darangshiensis]TCP31247.1 YidC/Oxa1 family membrane protein insertase [Scopulibacillus darangshiensis]